MRISVQDIEKTIESYERCWSALDFAALRLLWDEQEPVPVYLPEEAPAPLYGHEAIEAYWAVTAKAARSMRLSTAGLQLQPLAADLVAITFDMRWICEYGPSANPIGGDVRVSAVLRMRADGWRFIRYIEAPMAPLPYLRRLYEQFAAQPPPMPGTPPR